MKKQIMIDSICYLFIILFVYASFSKLIDNQKFHIQVGQSPMLADIAGFIAWFIPSVEMAISILLIFSSTRRLALYASFSLMVMFTTYIIVITNFSDYVPCSCGGVLQNMSWIEHLIFNVVFDLLAITAIILLDVKDKFSRNSLDENKILGTILHS